MQILSSVNTLKVNATKKESRKYVRTPAKYVNQKGRIKSEKKVCGVKNVSNSICSLGTIIAKEQCTIIANRSRRIAICCFPKSQSHKISKHLMQNLTVSFSWIPQAHG